MSRCPLPPLPLIVTCVVLVCCGGKPAQYVPTEEETVKAELSACVTIAKAQGLHPIDADKCADQVWAVHGGRPTP